MDNMTNVSREWGSFLACVSIKRNTLLGSACLSACPSTCTQKGQPTCLTGETEPGSFSQRFLLHPYWSEREGAEVKPRWQLLKRARMDPKCVHFPIFLFSFPFLNIWQVDEAEMRKQQDEITAIMKMRIAGSSSGTQVGVLGCSPD